MKTPVTKESLQHHWNYSWWKYMVLVVAAVFGWNLVYTTTAYQPPEEKKVVILSSCLGLDEELNAYMEQIRVTEMPDMEQMDCIMMFLDETYGAMQLSTYVAAGEGDIYVFDKANFQAYAGDGAFVALDEIEGMQEACEALGVDLGKCWRTNKQLREKHLYGVPLSALPGLQQYFYATGDYYVSIMINNQNDENVLKFFQILLRDMAAPPATSTDLTAGPLDPLDPAASYAK